MADQFQSTRRDRGLTDRLSVRLVLAVLVALPIAVAFRTGAHPVRDRADRAGGARRPAGVPPVARGVLPGGAVAVQATVFLMTTLAIDRPRPAVVHLDTSPPTSSFPSGQTAAAMALYGGISCWPGVAEWAGRSG
jgi:membrane-associated phospholipid phosphatase